MCHRSGAFVSSLTRASATPLSAWSWAVVWRPCCRATMGEVRGVRYRAKDGWHEVRAQVVVAADGWFSRVRSLAGLEPKRTPAAFDVLWFRLPRRDTDPAPGIFVSNGGWTVLHNRGTEWQVGSTIAKGSYPRVRAEGLDAVRRPIVQRVPWLADRM